MSHALLVVGVKSGDELAVFGADAAFWYGAEAVFVVVSHEVWYYSAKQVDEYGVVAAAGQFPVEGEVFFYSRLGVGALFQFAQGALYAINVLDGTPSRR